MTPEVTALLRRINELEVRLNRIDHSDKYVFRKPLTGETNGLRLGSTANDKIGFYNAAPIVQWSSGTGRQDVHDNSGATMQIGTRFTGNIGTAYYGFGDVVAFLKTIGLLQT